MAPEEVAAARRGEWSVVLTEQRPVPRDWFPPLAGAEVLCLASGGGQQGPLLAAVGARVTVFDASDAQLAQDRLVAERERLPLRLEQGDMSDLSRFQSGHFDLVFHPVSNCFAQEITVVWREAARVLRPGGVLLSGFLNPDLYIFDLDAADRGELVACHALPYSDAEHLPRRHGGTSAWPAGACSSSATPWPNRSVARSRPACTSLASTRTAMSTSPRRA